MVYCTVKWADKGGVKWNDFVEGEDPHVSLYINLARNYCVINTFRVYATVSVVHLALGEGQSTPTT